MLMNVTLSAVLVTPTQTVVTLLVVSHAHARKAGKETALLVQVTNIVMNSSFFRNYQSQHFLLLSMKNEM